MAHKTAGRSVLRKSFRGSGVVDTAVPETEDREGGRTEEEMVFPEI